MMLQFQRYTMGLTAINLAQQNIVEIGHGARSRARQACTCVEGQLHGNPRHTYSQTIEAVNRCRL